MIQKLLEQAGIFNISTISKIAVGFSNDVYDINDQYILKISRSKAYNQNIKKDICYCRLFKNQLPVPQMIYEGKSESQGGRNYFIYHKIKGENLYNLWHICTENQKRGYIRQICEMLKIINQAERDKTLKSWKEIISSKINSKLEQIKNRGHLPDKIISLVHDFIETVRLDDQNMALINWDLHFDNFLVKDHQIVGFLDFENVITASLDYQMTLVKRMVRNPVKYASDHAARLVAKEDYKNLIDEYQEFYPEMFDFTDISKRIRLYAIEHCLGDLCLFPDNEDLKKELDEYLRN